MKNKKARTFSCGILALAASITACSSDKSLGDNGAGSAHDVDHGGSTTGGSRPTASGSAGKTASCTDVQCFRAIECVASCGGPVLKSGCCPCDQGTFDKTLECSGNGGSAGRGGAGSGGTSGGGAGGNGGDPTSAGGVETQGGAGPSEPPAGLNESCVNGACPANLTPVKFYGVAGTAGPEFCWCTIPCADDPQICPEGTACTSIADGPGTVCYAP